jgi:hypothetical protein
MDFFTEAIGTDPQGFMPGDTEDIKQHRFEPPDSLVQFHSLNSQVNPGAQAGANAQAVGKLGTLQALASSTFPLTPFGGGTQARASIDVSDNGIVTDMSGKPLGSGSIVQLVLTIDFNGTVTPSVNLNVANATARMAIADTSLLTNAAIDADSSQSGNQFSTLFNARIGDPVSLSYKLDVHSHVFGNFGGTMEADYLHTAHYYITSSTPGVTVVSDIDPSFNYSRPNGAAVPEPSSLSLSLAGLAAAGLWGFRRRAFRSGS